MNFAEQCNPAPITIHYFVDEADDPTIFDRKGNVIVGSPGCSRYFILGKLDVADPNALTGNLEKLRAELLGDPYFAGIPSMLPTEKKTAVMFHAKDDVPEVRREVFKLLLAQNLKFYAVVRDKHEVAAYVRQQNDRDPRYRYSGNELYDTMVSRLFRSRFHKADEFGICFSKRGASDRTTAMKAALASALAEFERNFGIKNQAKVNISHARPPGCGGLQAVDYFLWAVQRFYEFEGTERQDTECRYVALIRDLTGEIDDPDCLIDGKRGAHWIKKRPLTLEARHAQRAKKKPGI